MEKESLLKEIQVLKKQIQWYKDTYETRSLLGIIKDRVFKLLNFKKDNLTPGSPLAEQQPSIDLFLTKEAEIQEAPLPKLSASGEITQEVKEEPSQESTKYKITYEDLVIDDRLFFDRDFYYEKYADVKEAKIDALEHYLSYGWREGRNPSRIFNTQFYLTKYPDVKQADMCPLVHYAFFGKNEGRVCVRHIGYESRMQTVNERLGIVPYFQNKYTSIALNDSVKSKKIGIHLHLHYTDMADYFIEKLKNINTSF